MLQSTLDQIKLERPPIHTKRDGEVRCIGLHSDALQYLFEQLTAGMQTLETGCGLSTLTFALANCFHQAIVPNYEHIEATKKKAASFNIDFDQVEFVVERSEFVLPRLIEKTTTNAILIDGGHAFPIPIIDWFYASQNLSVGGVLVVDDIHLKTVDILYGFLKKQPEWTLDKIINKTAFFVKNAPALQSGQWDYWKDQPYNSGLKAGWQRLLYFLKSKI